VQRILKFRSEIENLRIVEKTIDDISAEEGISGDIYGKIMVSAMEAVNNAIIHGNRSDKNKEVFVEIKVDGMALIISVEDQGQGFKPNDVPDPTKPENIENISGRGVFLMSRLADRIEFNDKGNRVTMYFKDIRA
jgi:serine/threonine-protein kinase RsbW